MGEWLPFTFALTGRMNGEHGTQGVALGYELAGLSARTEPQIGLSGAAAPPSPYYLVKNRAAFFKILNTLPVTGQPQQWADTAKWLPLPASKTTLKNGTGNRTQILGDGRL